MLGSFWHFHFPPFKSVSLSTLLRISPFLPVSILLGVICVHGVVVCPWRDHLAASTRRQHPEEKHRWLHRQVRKHTHLHEHTRLHKCVDMVHVHTYINTIMMCVCACVLQTHSRVDLLHGGAQSSRQEVRSCDAAILRPVPVRFWCCGAEWAGAGMNTYAYTNAYTELWKCTHLTHIYSYTSYLNTGQDAEFLQ